MSENVRVFTKEGLKGTLLDSLRSNRGGRVKVALDSGRVIEVSPSALRGRSPDSYWLDLDENEELSGAKAVTATEDVIVPVLAEELHLGKQPVTTGGIRVNRSVHHHDEEFDIPLMKEKVDVKRVLIEREVDGPLPVRSEGDVTIIPIVEEELVISKRYILKEEVHITKTTREEVQHNSVTLTREAPD